MDISTRSAERLRADAFRLMSEASKRPAAAHLYEQAGRLLRMADRMAGDPTGR